MQVLVLGQILSGSVSLTDLGVITEAIGGAAITIMATIVMAIVWSRIGDHDHHCIACFRGYWKQTIAILAILAVFREGMETTTKQP